MQCTINGNIFNVLIVNISIICIVYCTQVSTEPREHDSLHKSGNNGETSVQSVKDSVHESSDIIVVRETKDTVYILNKYLIDTLKKSIQEKIEQWNNRGFGFSGGFIYGLFAIRMTPVEEYIKVYKSLHPSFKINRLDVKNFSYEAFPLSGGKFYVGIGSGLRLGGYGIKGSNFFHDISLSSDSSYIGVQVGFGGLLLEKAVHRKKWNGKAGGIIGGGSMTISHGRNVFSEPASEASFFCLELHAGLSYSFFSLFHVGIDISLPAFFLHQGFPSYTNDFYTGNAGLVVNIVIGNLG